MFNNFASCRQNYKNTAFLLHCPWERELKNKYRDPDHLVHEYAYSAIHFRVGIYNLLFSSGIQGEYDFVIADHLSHHFES